MYEFPAKWQAFFSDVQVFEFCTSQEINDPGSSISECKDFVRVLMYFALQCKDSILKRAFETAFYV